jgi:MFS family permease
MPTHRILFGRVLAGTALMTAAAAVAGTAGSLAVADRLGAAWAGLPNTASVAGTALGAAALTRVMTTRGRGAGLATAYGLAAAGGCLATLAITRHALVPLLAGMALVGLGNAGAQLSRYAAADLYPPGRRGFAMGAVVWAGTLGAVGGPLLLGPAGAVATAARQPAMAGALAPAAACAAVAALAVGAVRRRRPVAPAAAIPAPQPAGSARPVLVAAALMITGYLVMVLVMTAMPVAIHLHGAGLGTVGWVLSAHTFGMFGLAPVTGRLCDRIGPRPVGLGGLGLLATAAAGLPGAATASVTEPSVLALDLFLVGLGWNLCVLAGSTILARQLPDPVATRVQGRVEAVVWGCTAVATLMSTMLFDLAGTGWLAALCLLLTAVAAVIAAGRVPAIPMSTVDMGVSELVADMANVPRADRAKRSIVDD